MAAYNSQEIFPIVDEQGNTIGRATRTECHSGSFLLHPVVHLHVFNSCGDLLLQKRSLSKDIQPGKWDTSVGGHIDYGETIEQALRREAFEELGITSFAPVHFKTYTFRSSREYELVHDHYCIYDGTFSPAPDEISEIRFWSQSEIERSIDSSLLTPNFQSEFQHHLLPLLEKLVKLESIDKKSS